MSHMQIDLPSPSPLRPISHKRARSSSSPLLDRPAKRVSLPLASATPSPLAGHVVQQEQPCLNTTLQLPPPSVFHEQRSPDDWVAKTNGLRLDGPLSGLDHMRTPPLPESGKWGSMDSVGLNNTMDGASESMNTNIRDASRDATVPWPFPTAPEHVTTQSPSNLANTNNTPFPSLLSPTKHPPAPTHAFTQHSNIHIHVQPATPPNHEPLQSSMSDPGPTSVSSSNSRVCSPSTPSSRRPRVTMGPRPDCEKCKMGVKGHWMHIE